MKPLKIVLTILLFCSLSAMNFAFAKPKSPGQVKVQSNKIAATAAAASRRINCYRHNTDICIVNVSGANLSFTIPELKIYGAPLPTQHWVNAYTSDYFDTLYVDISGTNFHQRVPDHSIIKIIPNTAGDAQVVKVIH